MVCLMLQLKYQLKDFINKYRDMSSAAEQADNDRNEILESLGDVCLFIIIFHVLYSYMFLFISFFALQWFETQQLEDVTSDNGSTELQDEYATTKITFEKLQRLNKDIVNANERGQSADHLQKEKQRLQHNVVHKFRAFKDLKKEEKKKIQPPNTDGMEQAWKMAASEICGLLNKVSILFSIHFIIGMPCICFHCV